MSHFINEGGYDDGYKSCKCFWGDEPGSLVRKVQEIIDDWRDLKVLDAGCGEGKNAAFLAEKGALVTAVDISPYAIANGKARWPDLTNIHWICSSFGDLPGLPSDFSLVIAYGLLHCLASPELIVSTVDHLMSLVSPGGLIVVCSFNNRHQDLSAHPGFHPCLIDHLEYAHFFEGWEIMSCTDADLHETHPHNGIPHTHSMTRIIARKPYE